MTWYLLPTLPVLGWGLGSEITLLRGIPIFPTGGDQSSSRAPASQRLSMDTLSPGVLDIRDPSPSFRGAIQAARGSKPKKARTEDETQCHRWPQRMSPWWNHALGSECVEEGASSKSSGRVPTGPHGPEPKARCRGPGSREEVAERDGWAPGARGGRGTGFPPGSPTEEEPALGSAPPAGMALLKTLLCPGARL